MTPLAVMWIHLLVGNLRRHGPNTWVGGGILCIGLASIDENQSLNTPLALLCFERDLYSIVTDALLSRPYDTDFHFFNLWRGDLSPALVTIACLADSVFPSLVYPGRGTPDRSLGDHLSAAIASGLLIHQCHFSRRSEFT